MMELSFSRSFVPWTIRFRQRMFQGTFVYWTIRSKERIILGTHSFPGPSDSWKFLIFLYHKRKSAVQNGQIYFYVNTDKRLVSIIGLDL